jgi:pentatricopeptide repeat protein
MYTYGNVNDPSSACWVFFNEMPRACGQRGRGSDSWNVLLGALALGCIGDQGNTVLDPLNSAAAQRNGKRSFTEEEYLESNPIFALVHGKTSLDASISILDAMRDRGSFQSASETWTMPHPNSQTYCQVATAVSGSGRSESNATMANKLFQYAKEDSAYIDGRLINALLRCFGDDIQSALNAWKNGMAAAAAGVGVVSGPSKVHSNIKQFANLAAAYNGLFHVCGRANRADIALRLCYAMRKAGVEPNEVSLNSYFAGKRIALDGKDGKGRMGLKKQFESLLTVECTKYSTKYKGRASDKKIRIILS